MKASQPHPVKPRIEARVDPQVLTHFQRGAEREQMRISTYLNLRLRELRALDLLLLKCKPEQRNLVRIVQKHLQLNGRNNP